VDFLIVLKEAEVMGAWTIASPWLESPEHGKPWDQARQLCEHVSPVLRRWSMHSFCSPQQIICCASRAATDATAL
jgi:hypothetical protein